MKLQKFERSPIDGEYKLYFLRERGWWKWKRTEQVVYVGSSTVWHNYPSFVSVGTMTNCWLYDVWTRLEYERKQNLPNPASPR